MKVKEQSDKVGLKLNIRKTKIMASGPITSWQIHGEIVETVRDFIYLFFFGGVVLQNHDQPRQHIQKQRHCFVNKGPSSQGYGFSSGHVWMWELDCEES